jgi:AcrR family transcriptional regulator
MPPRRSNPSSVALVDVPANQRSASLRARFATGSRVAKILHSQYSPREEGLIRNTYKVMTKNGAQRLSLREVAKQAKVSPGLLLYHFGSKDNLLLETMRWVLSRTVRRFEEGFADVHDPIAALEAFVDAVFLDAKANRDFYLVYLDLIQYRARNPSFRGLTELLSEHSTESFAFVIRQGVEAGVFSVDDIDRAALDARALVEGRFIQWLQDADWKQSHAALRTDCHHALLAMLRSGS